MERAVAEARFSGGGTSTSPGRVRGRVWGRVPESVWKMQMLGVMVSL